MTHGRRGQTDAFCRPRNASFLQKCVQRREQTEVHVLHMLHPMLLSQIRPGLAREGCTSARDLAQSTPLAAKGIKPLVANVMRNSIAKSDGDRLRTLAKAIEL